MPSLFSDKNALYLLTVLEAIEKIKLYAAPYKTAEVLFEAEDQLPYNGICHLTILIYWWLIFFSLSFLSIENYKCPFRVRLKNENSERNVQQSKSNRKTNLRRHSQV